MVESNAGPQLYVVAQNSKRVTLENKGIYSKCEQPSTQKFIPMRISVAYWKLLEIVIIYIIISKLLPKFYWSGILIKFPLSLVVIWQAKTYWSEPKLAWSWAQNKQTNFVHASLSNSWIQLIAYNEIEKGLIQLANLIAGLRHRTL